jgi:hypothetical protein
MMTNLQHPCFNCQLLLDVVRTNLLVNASVFLGYPKPFTHRSATVSIQGSLSVVTNAFVVRRKRLAVSDYL